jgi:hypothetical protein
VSIEVDDEEDELVVEGGAVVDGDEEDVEGQYVLHDPPLHKVEQASPHRLYCEIESE